MLYLQQFHSMTLCSGWAEALSLGINMIFRKSIPPSCCLARRTGTGEASEQHHESENRVIFPLVYPSCTAWSTGHGLVTMATHFPHCQILSFPESAGNRGSWHPMGLMCKPTWTNYFHTHLKTHTG